MNKEDCTFCQLATTLAKNTVYEDDMMKAVLVDKPSTPGQIELFPKSHITIFEQLPDAETEKMFIMANKLSTAMFESLGMHGTNIIVNNGIAAGQKQAHFSIQIVPRRENDGLNLDWKTKHLEEEEMSTVELILKPHTEMPFKKEEPKQEKEAAPRKDTIKDDTNNYLIRQLRRIP